VDDRTNKLKERKKMNYEELNEELKNEIVKASEMLNMDLEEAKTLFFSICEQNNINPVDDPNLARGLWRAKFGQLRFTQEKGNEPTKSNSLTKTAFGFFASVEEARDFQDYNRKQVDAEYRRDSETTYKLGKVAVQVVNGDEQFQISRYRNGEEEVIVNDKLHPAAIEVNEGTWIIPLDTRSDGWDGKPNPQLGKPLPKTNWVRRGLFIGSIDGGEPQCWTFQIKGEPAVLFAADTYRWINMTVIPNLERGFLYGIKTQTIQSLQYNDELDEQHDNYRDVSQFSYHDMIAEHMNKYLSPLVELDRYHAESLSLPTSQRYIVTDGNVTNMNMNPTKTGNRAIGISDLLADFDYGGEGYSSTTCWVPPHIEIDFGIGSNIVVVGRTNQYQLDDGTMSQVSVNVFGVYVLDKRGEPMASVEGVEEDFDWF